MGVRVSCYIDGFNLYHSIVGTKLPHLKWLNLWALGESMLKEGETLVTVKYFSAFAKWLPDPYRRHRAYVAALETVGVSPVMSHFKNKSRSCRKCGHTWKAHEEKETDVRLAIELLEDGYDDCYDRAIVVSGDSGLVPVLASARARFVDKSFYVAAPPGQFASSRDIRGAAHGFFELRPGRLKRCLFPEEVFDCDGELIATRPNAYNP